MDASSIGMLLACGLAVFAGAVITLELAPVAHEARCRRRRRRMRLVVGGAGDIASRSAQRAAALRPSPREAQPSSWDPVPVGQWQPPREGEPEPSPAA